MGPLRLLTLEHVGDNVGVRDGGHRSKTVILGFAIVNLTAVILDGSLGGLEPLPRR